MSVPRPIDLELAMTAALVMGVRHGFDYDHIAAISDLSRLEKTPRGAMRLGIHYVLGHAATVTLLAAGVILFQRTLPLGIDRWAERLVGVTLVVLGLYVLATLFQAGRQKEWVPTSRFLLLANAVRWCAWRVRRIFGDDTSDLPLASDRASANLPAFVVGSIHGLGAETPSQLLLFLLAANLGGTARGFLGLLMFLIGLVAMNTLMCASMAGIGRAGARRPAVTRLISMLAAGYSVIVGAIFLVGSSWILPALGG